MENFMKTSNNSYFLLPVPFYFLSKCQSTHIINQQPFGMPNGCWYGIGKIFLGAHLTDINAEEIDDNDEEQTYCQCGKDAADDFYSFEPNGIAPAYCLQSRPNAV